MKHLQSDTHFAPAADPALILDCLSEPLQTNTMVNPKAISRLKSRGLEILVENGDELLFASDRKGLAPLCDLTFNHPELLDGSDLAMPVVDLPAALLLIFGKVGRVFAGTMTSAARGALKEVGIEHDAGEFVRKLPPNLVANAPEYDSLAKESVTPLAFAEAVKRRGW